MSTPPLLPCGHDPLEVADHAAAGALDEHERDCPHCGAVAAATALSGRIGSDAAARAALATPEPPPDLVPGVMRSVRTELRTAREIPLDLPDGGAAVTDHVVATTLRDALDAGSRLVVASCRVEVVPGFGLTVRVEALGRYPDDLAAAVTALRALVAATLDREFGLAAAGGIDVAVVDLVGTP